MEVQGHFGEAEGFYRRSLNIKRAVIGSNPGTAMTVYNLASVLATQRKFTQALKLFEESLEMRKRVLREDHPDVLRSQRKCGEIRAKVKKKCNS